MDPVTRDIKALTECATDTKSIHNAKTIYVPRAVKHHSALIRVAVQLGRGNPFYKVFMNDANNVKLAVSKFNKLCKSVNN